MVHCPNYIWPPDSGGEMEEMEEMTVDRIDLSVCPNSFNSIFEFRQKKLFFLKLVKINSIGNCDTQIVNSVI